MKKMITGLFFTIMFLYPYSNSFCQSCDLLYFCEKYDGEEINCADRFYKGKLTVMVRLSKEIFFTKVFVQLDKYNPREGKFEFYKDYNFNTDSTMTYIYFNDIEFSDKGFYRVFLLDPDKNTITSGLIEII
jgi:hypothetical protein